MCVSVLFLFSDRTQRPESPVGAELPAGLPRVPDPPKKVQQECHRLQREDAGDGTGIEYYMVAKSSEQKLYYEPPPPPPSAVSNTWAAVTTESSKPRFIAWNAT